MSLNRRLYKKIDNMHKDGISREMTISLFINMAKTENDAAEAIEEFYIKNYRLVERNKKPDLPPKPRESLKENLDAIT